MDKKSSVFSGWSLKKLLLSHPTTNLRLSKCNYFEFSDFIFQLNIKDFCVFSGWYLKKLVLPHP